MVTSVSLHGNQKANPDIFIKCWLLWHTHCFGLWKHAYVVILVVLCLSCSKCHAKSSGYQLFWLYLFLRFDGVQRKTILTI